MSLGRWYMMVAILAGAAVPASAGDIRLVLPNVTIYPGDIIADAQIIERLFPEGSVGKYPLAGERSMVVGKVARRTLLPGKPIPLTGVRDPDVISRGGTVIAMFKAGGLTITSTVTPLRAGQVGDVIEARNNDSGQIIRGVVQADGTLRVGLAQ